MLRKPAQSHAAAPHRVVIAGGGVAGLEAMLALRALAEDRVAIDLLAPENEFIYGPLAVAEPFGLGRRAHFDLGELARDVGARHHREALVSVDVRGRRARTRAGIEFPYDALLVAAGARYRDPLPGALIFPGPMGVTRIRHLLTEIENGEVSRVVFALAGRVGWSLPLYELALMTANHLQPGRRDNVELTLVTPEDRPLGLFGPAASAVIRDRLERSGIRLRTSVHPAEYADGALRLVPGGVIAADRVVTLAAPVGTTIAGLPVDDDGFVPVDEHGRVDGLDGVYAAGDVTSFPIKQGGVAAQLADAAAQSIAADAGALVTPVPFKPVLRGLILTGAAPAYLRAPLTGGHGEGVDIAVEPLWWPPAKIAAKYLGPFLALRAEESAISPEAATDALPVACEFDRDLGEWRDLEETSTQPAAA